ncbi:MAG: ribbon-helix-helix protein, CopG family [Candidatus Sulfotelmatobacter sp.]
MRFRFDERKSVRLRANPERGIGFEEAQEIFSHPYYLDQRSDLAEQYARLAGLRRGCIRSFSRCARTKRESITASSRSGARPGRSNIFMNKTRKRSRPVPAETIARLADRGKDVSRFFTNAGRMMAPIQRVNVDLAPGMLEELDRAAKELNISRQAVIKTLIRQALDQQYLARQHRSSGRA